MELMALAIENLLSFQVLIALIVGSLGGVIIGAIPGVGAAVAIAILLPATYSLEPIVGLTLLLGIYGSSMYGGAIPAILINTPGTAVNALTTYDGYPMTQRGEARKALSLAYSASLFGGLFSIICLILFSGLLAKVAPQFGSREIFLAALLGSVLVVFAHRGQVFAAAMLLGVGILLDNVGFEMQKFSTVYTFDQKWLRSGVNLIVLVLGLFAISQAFQLLLLPDKSDKLPPLEGRSQMGIAALFKHKRVATVSASLGSLMGVIPGVGEFTAQFMSYTYARRTSKQPELFGKGSEEGLVASETANNAVPAAAMIPLLSLGIPGEALTAMMLSVLYVHGVVPGPELFASDMDFVISLYISLLLLNLLVFGFLYLGTGKIAKLVEVPTRLLGIIILTLSFVGVYSMRNSFSDCAMAAVIGVFGLILKRLNLPVVPIVLGMVLGSIMKDKLRASMMRVDSFWDMINRPIAFMLFSMIVLFLLAQVYGLIRRYAVLEHANDR